MRKIIFEKELQDNLLLLPVENVDQETLNVIKYLQEQIAEINKTYGQ